MKRHLRLSLVLAIVMGLSGTLVFAQEAEDYYAGLPEIPVVVQEVTPFFVAQEAGSNDGVEASRPGPRLTLNLSVFADAFTYNARSFAHRGIRPSINHQNISWWTGPFTGMEGRDPHGAGELGDEDTSLRVGFETDRFGGSWTFAPGEAMVAGTDGLTARNIFGQMYAWVRFGSEDMYVRVLGGTGHDFTHTDDLGGDIGVFWGGTAGAANAIYPSFGNTTWMDKVNPDNITQGHGAIALNMVFRDLTVDLAAGLFFLDPELRPAVGSPGEFLRFDDFGMQYGARVGYRFSDIVRANISYSIRFDRRRGLFGEGAGQTVVPLQPGAEEFNHLFGAYVTLFPFGNDVFGITLGYSAAITSFLDYVEPAGVRFYAINPLVWRHGINLNARYNGLLNGALRLRTDNTVSFFSDKDYSVFDVTPLGGWAVNWNATISPDARYFPYVQHFFLRNRLVVQYDLPLNLPDDRNLMLQLEVRNMFRRDSADPGASLQAVDPFIYTQNELFLEGRAQYDFTAGISVFAGLRFQHRSVFRSASLTGQMPGLFWGDMVMPRDAVDIRDSAIRFSVPVGMIMSW